MQITAASEICESLIPLFRGFAQTEMTCRSIKREGIAETWTDQAGQMALFYLEFVKNDKKSATSCVPAMMSPFLIIRCKEKDRYRMSL